jgi:hypothetical protein
MRQFSFFIFRCRRRTAADRKSFYEKSSHSSSSLSVVFKTVIRKGKDFKDVIKLWAGPKLMVFLADPRDIELVLSSQVYLDKSPEYRFFKPWLGNGLLISSGEVKSFDYHLTFPFVLGRCIDSISIIFS